MESDTMNVDKKSLMTVLGLALALLFISMSWSLMKFGGLVIDLADDNESGKWVTSAFIIAEVALIPVAGKIIDHVGMKPLILLGTILFVGASIAVTFSDAMRMMVICRFIQGVGGAMLFACAFSSPGLLFKHGERGIPHELMTGAFAIGSLFGAAIGFYFVDNLGWRYLFYIPAAMVLLGGALALVNCPAVTERRGNFDILGSVLIFISILLAMYYTQAVSKQFEMFSPESALTLYATVSVLLALYCHLKTEMVVTGARLYARQATPVLLLATVGVLCGCLLGDFFDISSWYGNLFVLSIAAQLVALWRLWYGKVAADPILPRDMDGFRIKIILAILFIAIAVIGLLQFYVKVYMTHINFSIYEACGMFIFLLMGGAITSAPGGHRVPYTGVRPWAIFGCAMCALSLLLTGFIVADGWVQMAVCLFIMGLGLGSMITLLLISLQALTPEREMGVISSTTMGLRVLAISIGITLYSRYCNERIIGAFERHSIDFHGESVLDLIMAFILYGEAVMEDVLSTIAESFKECALIAIAFCLVGLVLAYNMMDLDKGLCGEAPHKKKRSIFKKHSE